MESSDLARLTAALEREGLAAFLAAFAPHATRRDRWAREVHRLNGHLRPLVDLFLLGEAVPVADLPADVAAAVPPLVAAGAARVDGDHASLAGLSLFRPYGVWLFAEPPGPAQASAYFGPDSLALAMHTTYRPGGSCLDLCAGPGFQGLAALARCATATLVELTGEAAAVAALNVAVNGVADRVRVRAGDLYAPVADERFDHVVANVPFMPVPPGHPFPVAGAGGPDGFDVARRVLHQLPGHLRDGGSAHLATMLLRGPDGLLLAEELSAWAREADCDVTVTLTSQIPTTADSPLVLGTAEAIAAAGDTPVGALVEQVADHYAALGASSASWAFLRVDPGGGRLRPIELGGAGRRAPWVSLV
ncbi:methyltransferase [Luedemannella helvata]|uniref:Methyltransferase small domain-containing protein n=1 Tax=Luedemannella helvata TaxID=349315 RepID=A0ABN2KV09_9ACTN